MSTIQFNCGACNATLKIPQQHVGKQLRCPKCQEVMVVPDPSELGQPAAPEPQQLVSQTNDPLGQMGSGAPTSPASDTASPYAAPQPNRGGAVSSSTGAPVNSKDFVAKGTSFHSMVGTVFAFGGIAVAAAVTFGVALIFGLIALLVHWLNQSKILAVLRGSGVEVSPQQFPEIHETVRRLAGRLGMRNVPDVFIIESNDLNAGAIKTGSKQSIILIDDLVHGLQATGDQRTLDFVIGHELAHHALGHTGMVRGHVRTIWRPLSRLDEFSCDAVAAALTDTETALRAITLLTVGPQLYSRVNQDALRKQAEQVMKNKKSKKAETTLTHPLILRRYAALLGMKI